MMLKRLRQGGKGAVSPGKVAGGRKRRRQQSQTGIALFMVISAVALLSILMAEFTYSTQINARLAYNYVDNLKAYYLAKAAFKLSLVRLKAYVQVKDFMNNPANKQVAAALDKNMIEQIWSQPLVFPITIPKEASMIETESLKTFMKDSKLEGSYMVGISGESTKLNLNNLLLKNLPADQSASPTPGAKPTPAPTPQATGTPSPMDFREVLEPAINALVEQKKTDDREFADVYRNVNGKDVIDAIMSYLDPNFQAGSNLPGFTPIKAKGAPLYSMSELHMVPGIDDAIFNLLEPTLTVYSTPGINVNKITKSTLMSLVPGLTDEEADDIIRKRDDPDAGKPFKDDTEFWNTIGSTSVGKSLEAVKSRWQKAGLKPIFDEQSFKIGIETKVGQAIRRLEAYVIYDPKAAKQGKNQPVGTNPATGNPPGVNVAGQPPGGAPGQQDEASAKKPSGLTLIYWRML